MVSQKVVSVVSQAAADQIGLLMAALHMPAIDDSPTIYSAMYAKILRDQQVTPEELRRRVHAYTKTIWGDSMTAKSLAGNLIKEATNPNMGQKIFLKMMRALFPQA